MQEAEENELWSGPRRRVDPVNDLEPAEPPVAAETGPRAMLRRWWKAALPVLIGLVVVARVLLRLLPHSQGPAVTAAVLDCGQNKEGTTATVQIHNGFSTARTATVQLNFNGAGLAFGKATASVDAGKSVTVKIKPTRPDGTPITGSYTCGNPDVS